MNMNIKFLVLLLAGLSIFSCIREKTEVTKFWNGGRTLKILDNGINEYTWFSTQNQKEDWTFDNRTLNRFFVAENSGDFLTHFSLKKSYLKVYENFGEGWVFLKEDYFDENNLAEIPKNKNEKLKNLAGKEDFDKEIKHRPIIYFGRDFSNYINYFKSDNPEEEIHIFRVDEKKLRNNAFIFPDLWTMLEPEDFNAKTQALKIELHYTHISKKEVVQSFIIGFDDFKNLQEKMLAIKRNF